MSCAPSSLCILISRRLVCSCCRISICSTTRRSTRNSAVPPSTSPTARCCSGSSRLPTTNSSPKRRATWQPLLPTRHTTRAAPCRSSTTFSKPYPWNKRNQPTRSAKSASPHLPTQPLTTWHICSRARKTRLKKSRHPNSRDKALSTTSSSRTRAR